MPIKKTEAESAAFLAMAQKVRAALTERDELIRHYRERYDRLHGDPRVSPAQLFTAAEELVRVACKADHVYEESIAEGLVDYQHQCTGSDGSRF